jgi:hypothetical protein
VDEYHLTVGNSTVMRQYAMAGAYFGFCNSHLGPITPYTLHQV